MYVKIMKNNREGSKRGLVMIRLFIEKLQKGFPFLAPKGSDFRNISESDKELEVATVVPEDVKEGHFVVLAVKDDETQRFVVELCYLGNSEFLKLLKEAGEEYGFQQKGALTLPCRPRDLQKILQEPCKITTAATENWVTCTSSTIGSY